MSTAQIHSHIGLALVLSACAHALVFTASSWTFSGDTRQSRASVLQVVLNPQSSQGIHTRLKYPNGHAKGAGGIRKQQTQKNPPAPFAKGGVGDQTHLSLAQQTREGDFASAKSGGGPSPHNIIKPEYTQRALRLGIQGDVVLGITIGVDGKVVSAKITKSLGYGLDEAARDAILKSTFLPARNSQGEGVEEQITYRTRFELVAQ